MNREEIFRLFNTNRTKIIHAQALIEGIATTQADTDIIINNMLSEKELENNYESYEIQEIINLSNAWNYMLNTLDIELTPEYVMYMHSILAKNVMNNNGRLRVSRTQYEGLLRTEAVSIGTSSYTPPVISYAQSYQYLLQIINAQNYNNPSQMGLSLFANMSKQQFFYDVNKRTATLIANKVLMQYGIGILHGPTNKKSKWVNKLLDYYEGKITLQAYINYLQRYYLLEEGVLK